MKRSLLKSAYLLLFAAPQFSYRFASLPINEAIRQLIQGSDDAIGNWTYLVAHLDDFPTDKPWKVFTADYDGDQIAMVFLKTAKSQHKWHLIRLPISNMLPGGLEELIQRFKNEDGKMEIKIRTEN